MECLIVLPVSDLHEEGKNAINAPLLPTGAEIHPEDTLLGIYTHIHTVLWKYLSYSSNFQKQTNKRCKYAILKCNLVDEEAQLILDFIYLLQNIYYS